GFLILRRHGSLILSLFAMMISTGLPELSSEKDLNYLRETLVLDLTEDAALDHFRLIMTKTCLCLLLHIIWAVTTQAQHKSHSLQTAVDALHRREAQLALRDYESAHASPDDDGYYNGNGAELEHIKQQELNKLLANYLGSDDDDREQSPYDEEFDDEDYNGFDERKRSIFRERGIPDSPYQSVFRERESDSRQPDLAAQFLREIDRERNFEREEAYKENLRRLWEKYQQQENEIEEELFDDDKQGNISPQSYWGPPPEKRRL
ncbi:Phosphatidylinositol 4,5-bisphosphate 3-kinase catalytic subunit delta isoform, partial [Pseudolycoriella hygida]